MVAHRTLTTEEQRAGLASVDRWRSDGARGPASCFVCLAETMTVINASTPPHAEWYLVSCPDCALDAVLHRPMASFVATSNT